MRTDPDPWPAGEWRRHLSDAVRDLDELLEILELEGEALAVGPTSASVRRFPLRVPRGFVGRMERGNPDDPLLRQVLPRALEDHEVDGFTADPVGELGIGSQSRLLAKYRGRVLLVTTGACAVHCRYCFRRHFPYDDHRAEGGGWSRALDAIAADPTVEEVILSGGDPLVVDDRALADLAARVSEIPHIRRLRIHTRTPVVLPERVDEALVSWLSGCDLPVTVVVHVNHPREIDGDVRRALAVLAGAGAILLNQAVLLQGVNDSAEVLEELSKRLFDCGVLPYYLHLLDPVAGAAHFDVDEARALELMDQLRACLPGYLVPRLVREIVGARSKVVVS